MSQRSHGSLMLLANPAAGRRAAERSLSKVVRALYDGGFHVTTFVTAQRGEATELVKQFGAEYDRLVCMGGDGTFNETVSGMLEAGLDLPVGFIPCGSTNDFASVHGLSSDQETAAAAAASQQLHRIDAARFNESYFTFHAAFGWLANVVNTTPQDVKNILGYTAYLLDGIKDLTAVKPVWVRFTTPDGAVHEGDYIYGGMLSTLSLGGNIVSFPPDLVRTDDGLFEVFLVRMPHDLLELSELLFLLQTGTLENRYTEFFRVSEMQAQSAVDMNWSLDGERYTGAGTRAAIEVLPKRILLAGGKAQ